MTYKPTRPIMTRAELASHQVTPHEGEAYDRSGDGYDDMEDASQQGWHSIAGWGRDGYDLGDWPYVVVSVRGVEHNNPWQLRVTCEGDVSVYQFANKEDCNAAIDYLHIWYGIGEDYDTWPALGIPGWCDETKTYPARKGLDEGYLRVPDELRGPFSWARVEAEKPEGAEDV